MRSAWTWTRTDSTALGTDKFTPGMDKYTLGIDKFTLGEDKYTLKIDLYSLCLSKYDLRASTTPSLRTPQRRSRRRLATGASVVVAKRSRTRMRSWCRGRPSSWRPSRSSL
jgi:hypothetical protein